MNCGARPLFYYRVFFPSRKFRIFQENFSLFRNHLRAVWPKSCSSMVGLFGLYYMALYQPVLELLYCCYSPNNSGIQLCHIIICRQYFKQFLWQNQLFSYRSVLINAYEKNSKLFATDKIPILKFSYWSIPIRQYLFSYAVKNKYC